MHSFFLLSIQKQNTWKTIHKQSEGCTTTRKRFGTHIYASQISHVQHNCAKNDQTKLKSYCNLKKSSATSFYFFANNPWQIQSSRRPQERWIQSCEIKCLTRWKQQRCLHAYATQCCLFVQLQWSLLWIIHKQQLIDSEEIGNIIASLWCHLSYHSMCLWICNDW